jgi:hypothetical protein
MADNRSFDRWLRTVESIVRQRCGMTTYAVPDLRLRAAFDAGISPEAFCEKELGLPPTTVVLDHHGGIGLLFELLFG